MANIAGLRTASALTARASEKFIPKFVSEFYKFSPLLAAMTAQDGSDRELRPAGDKETPGSVRSTFIGGSNFTYAQKMSIKGSLEAEWNVQTATGPSDSVKNLALRDTSTTMAAPTTDSQDLQEIMTQLCFSHKEAECIVWNSSLIYSRGKYQISNAMDHATRICMQDMLDHLINELWQGSPADQTVKRWSEQSGVNDVCSATNTLYGIDRNASGYFLGKRDTTARAASLSLVDTANLGDAAVSLEGIRVKNTRGVNFGLANTPAYAQMKQEAMTKGLGQIIMDGNPIAARYGIKNEALAIGNTVITFDPGLTAYSTLLSESGAVDLSDAVVFFDIGDWFFETQEGYNFHVGPFINLKEYARGAIDARRSLFELGYRFGCFDPKNQVLFTNITTS